MTGMDNLQPRRQGGGICASVAAPDWQAALDTARPVAGLVDVVEIRLDTMAEINLPAMCRCIERPLLFTNRPKWEGGAFKGSEDKRLEILLEAVRCGADYVDLELKSDPRLRGRLLEGLADTGTRLILSHHDFASTPDFPALSGILKQQRDSGADIGKIVTLASDHLDVIRVLRLLEDAHSMGFPLIAFCMGEAGRLSRIITLLLGGFMTYAAPAKNGSTAPGQLTVHELREALACLPGGPGLPS
jgi:3-dehydroquinate dehydratase-1/3-dehydroquinate dehydratase/shikimate dehydrogenase